MYLHTQYILVRDGRETSISVSIQIKAKVVNYFQSCQHNQP